MVNPAQQQGSALLSVLLILGVVSALMVTLLDGISTNVRVTQNAQESVFARYNAHAAEALAALELERLLAKSSGVLANVGGWNGKTVPVPLDRGLMTLQISDQTNCFNINALVTPGAGQTGLQTGPRLGPTLGGGIWPDQAQRYRGSLQMQRQFIALLEALEFSRSDAQRVTAAIVDWIDSDTIAAGLGAEDGRYMSAKKSYRTANQLLRSVSEILDVAGVTPDMYERMFPFICAHPGTQPSAMNVNLMQPADAPLLMMLMPRKITRDAALRVLSSVPELGWQSVADFWSHPALLALQPTSQAIDQTAVKSDYFVLNVSVEVGRGHAMQTALFAVQQGRPVRAARSWQERI